MTELSLGIFGAVTSSDGSEFSVSTSGSIDHATDCAGTYYGDAEDLGCGCGEAGPSGCDDECGSTAELDECGVCGGDGIADGACDCSR